PDGVAMAGRDPSRIEDPSADESCRSFSDAGGSMWARRSPGRAGSIPIAGAEGRASGVPRLGVDGVPRKPAGAGVEDSRYGSLQADVLSRSTVRRAVRSAG